MTRSTMCRAVLVVALSPSLAVAQGRPEVPTAERPVRAHFGLDFTVGQPIGQFGDFIDAGFGVSGNFVLPLDPQGILGLRLQAGFVNYGNETKRVCLSTTVTCRIRVDVKTSNNIFMAGLGPQITAPRGPLRPYIGATAGLSYFFTESSVEGTNNDDSPFASTTNQDDVVFAWTGGGGILIPIRTRTNLWMIDLGARYHGNGRAEYLREGSITDNPDGTINIDRIRSEANLMTYHVGIAIPIR